MDGREHIDEHGRPVFYMFRGGTGSTFGSGQHPRFYGTPAPHPSCSSNEAISRPMFYPEQSSSVPQHGDRQGGTPQVKLEQIKRERAGKDCRDGTVELALSSISFGQDYGSGDRQESFSGSGLAASTQKKQRGRPRGSGWRQKLAALGGLMSLPTGTGFLPHVILISEGEDIASKILLFSQQVPKTVCVMCANGTVSTVTLRHPTDSGSTVTYKGHFELIGLTGTYFGTNDDDSKQEHGVLKISLSDSSGLVFGGEVYGPLISATSMQVIVGSFNFDATKANDMTKADSSAETLPSTQRDNNLMTDSGTSRSESSIQAMYGTRPMHRKDPHKDFDLTRG